MRSIVLEILRDGPPQNQLISPITRYLALCGEHSATALVLPFEHAQWLGRMGGLTYRDSEQTRQAQLTDVSSTLRAILDTIPGFVAELARCHASGPEGPESPALPRAKATIHLRLVLNANELALLPFELAQAPAGFPAAGQPLALQTEVPICITREVRRSSTLDACFRRRPKILFAYAHPEADVPFQAHLLELRRAIEPWLYANEPAADLRGEARQAARDELRRVAVGEHLTLLPRATMSGLTELCATGEYTHVHLLAHGVRYRRGDDWRFGLALHQSNDPFQVDVVDGERLAVALRRQITGRSQTLAAPLVVSLAACDAANQGSVVGAGASIAHELHLKGVPLVVASQFPLSKEGSVHLVRLLYEGLLWGADPRHVLDDLRRQLRALLPRNHDWASLVVYAALPADIRQQSEALAFEQARRSIRAALSVADASIRGLSLDADGKLADEDRGYIRRRANPIDDLLREPSRKLAEAARRLNELLATTNANADEIHGLLAATDKRMAELRLHAARKLGTLDAIAPGAEELYRSQAADLLRSSRRHYERSFDVSRHNAWALVQSLSLAEVLSGLDQAPAPESTRHPQGASTPPAPVEDAAADPQWELARLISVRDTDATSAQVRLWAHSNLCELFLLQLISKPDAPRALDQALEHAGQVERLASQFPDDAHSFIRQIQRYWGVFSSVNTRLQAATQSALRLRVAMERLASRLRAERS